VWVSECVSASVSASECMSVWVCECIVDALVQACRWTKLFMCRTFNLYMAKYILHLQNALPSLSSKTEPDRPRQRECVGVSERGSSAGPDAGILGCWTQGLALFFAFGLDCCWSESRSGPSSCSSSCSCCCCCWPRLCGLKCMGSWSGHLSSLR